MGQITTEKITMVRTKNKKTMGQITMERTTMGNKSPELLSLQA